METANDLLHVYGSVLVNGPPTGFFQQGLARGSSFTVVQFGDGVFESFDQQSKAGRLSRGRVSGSG